MAIDTTSLRSRRALLAGTVGGLAAVAAQALGRPAPAQAAHAGAVQLGHANSATQSTQITSTTLGVTAFYATGGGTGSGVYGLTDSGYGVWGFASDGTGVFGESRGADGASVHGFKQTTGPAVKGQNIESTNGYAAVYGLTNGTGPATYGENTANGNGASGVARGTGSGVYGRSDNGRGGRFSGQKAQIRLDPSTSATHPSSGQAGDIFLDAAKRLWLCKSGTNWVRIV